MHILDTEEPFSEYCIRSSRAAFPRMITRPSTRDRMLEVFSKTSTIGSGSRGHNPRGSGWIADQLACHLALECAKIYDLSSVVALILSRIS